MKKESLPKAEIGETRDKTQETLDRGVLWLLKTHRDVTNSGNKGIIFKFTREELPEVLKEELEKSGITFDAVATKVLKVFDPVAIRREYEMMIRASEIISGQEDKEDLAHIRSPLILRNVSIDSETREFLATKGCHLMNDVGVIIMDFIEGEDLATHIYKQALLLSDNFTQEQLDQMSFDLIHFEVEKLIGFSRPGRKGSTEGEKIYEEAIVQSKNFELLVKFLKRKGFVLDKKILDILKKTIEILHDNRLFHNDLHERNAMIGRDASGKLRISIVDFGNASVGIISNEDASFRVTDDMDLIRRLETLTISAKEEADQLRQQLVEQFVANKLRFESSPKWLNKIKHLENLDQNDLRKELNKNFVLNHHSEAGLDDFLIIVTHIAEVRHLEEFAINYLRDMMIGKTLREVQKRKFRVVVEYLSK